MINGQGVKMAIMGLLIDNPNKSFSHAEISRYVNKVLDLGYNPILTICLKELRDKDECIKSEKKKKSNKEYLLWSVKE